MIDMSCTFEDRFKGVLFGQAVGDALGLGTEFMSRAQVRDKYSDGLSAYDQIIRDAHRKRWKRGDWTDDTEQMTLIVDSLLEKREIDVCDIARRFAHWEGQGGLGVGDTVYAVLHHPKFFADPHAAAADVWGNTGRWQAANGAVMRTAALGLWEGHDESKVMANAENVCKITHFDPRCVASCVAVCVAIRRLVHGEGDVESIIAHVRELATAQDPRVAPFFDLAESKDIESLILDDEDSMGYTLKTLSAGIWALRFASSYEEGITAVIHQGGDADTNASVAGALLGARFGYESIPRPWIEGLTWRKFMNRVAEELYQGCAG
jgi:ADP-ribosylglycohydrolase